MNKINNALIIDDQINLTLDEIDTETDSFRSLKSIQNYFLKNSIPISILNNLADSPIDAIERLKSIPKPDLVVLDLDLNSNGEIDETDISLLALILKTLKSNFGEFIILIYSSQADTWEDTRNQILLIDECLNDLLDSSNVIVFEKFLELTTDNSEKLGTQIMNKIEYYKFNTLLKISKSISNKWNKEVLIFAFFAISLIIILKLSYFELNNMVFSTTIVAVIVVALKFVLNRFRIEKQSN